MNSTESLLRANEALRKEADDIMVRRGLLRVLRDYGKPHVVGSYSLQTMVWRDLDLYLETDAISETRFLELGAQLVSMLNPTKMSFRSTRAVSIQGLPTGLYWGVYENDRSERGWKIDIWAIDSMQCEKLIQFQESIRARITETALLKILSIKSQVWRDPEYRRSFIALDVYSAVLDHGVGDINGFRSYLERRKAADLQTEGVPN